MKRATYLCRIALIGISALSVQGIAGCANTPPCLQYVSVPSTRTVIMPGYGTAQATSTVRLCALRATVER